MQNKQWIIVSDITQNRRGFFDVRVTARYEWQREPHIERVANGLTWPNACDTVRDFHEECGSAIAGQTQFVTQPKPQAQLSLFGLPT